MQYCVEFYESVRRLMYKDHLTAYTAINLLYRCWYHIACCDNIDLQLLLNCN